MNYGWWSICHGMEWSAVPYFPLRQDVSDFKREAQRQLQLPLAEVGIDPVSMVVYFGSGNKWADFEKELCRENGLQLSRKVDSKAVDWKWLEYFQAYDVYTIKQVEDFLLLKRQVLMERFALLVMAPSQTTVEIVDNTLKLGFLTPMIIEELDKDDSEK